jgi:hypothetical protein
MNRSKSLETCLVLTTGFLLVYFFTENALFLKIALVFGLVGIFIKTLANYIAIAWFKLADVLNYFVSKIVLGSIFFIILFPISLLYRISKNDKLHLKRPVNSNWIVRNYSYKGPDLENIW